jgi:hypothetical protein
MAKLDSWLNRAYYWTTRHEDHPEIEDRRQRVADGGNALADCPGAGTVSTRGGTVLNPIDIGIAVTIRPNHIWPRLAGRTGTVASITAWGPCANKDTLRRDQRCGGNVIVAVPSAGRVLLRPEDVEVSA